MVINWQCRRTGWQNHSLTLWLELNTPCCCPPLQLLHSDDQRTLCNMSLLLYLNENHQQSMDNRVCCVVLTQFPWGSHQIFIHAGWLLTRLLVSLPVGWLVHNSGLFIFSSLVNLSTYTYIYIHTRLSVCRSFFAVENMQWKLLTMDRLRDRTATTSSTHLSGPIRHHTPYTASTAFASSAANDAVGS